MAMSTTNPARPKLTEEQAREAVRRLRLMPRFRWWGIKAKYFSQEDAETLGDAFRAHPDVCEEHGLDPEHLEATAHTMIGWNIYADRFPDGVPEDHVYTPEEEKCVLIVWDSWPFPDEAA